MTEYKDGRGDEEKVQRRARQDHEANCRNEPEWPYLSVNHRHVHEVNARRLLLSKKVAA